MKYFTFIIFLLLSIFVNAQMNMEEISYIPSHSGYYNNLIVKGDAKINEIYTYPFDVISYGSRLQVKALSPAQIFIGLISVSTGTVSLYSTFSLDDVSGWQIETPHIDRSGKTASPSPIPLRMDGGNLSLSRSGSSPSLLKIDPIYFEPSVGKTPLLSIRTENFNFSTTNGVAPFVDNLYIFGMRIPDCQNKYYWQPVKVEGVLHYILACNNTGCKNPEYEEACLQKNGGAKSSDPFTNQYSWNTSNPPNCYCEKNSVNINIDDPTDF